jgi:hypothetical protein
MVQRSYEMASVFERFVEQLSTLRPREAALRTRAVAG